MGKVFLRSGIKPGFYLFLIVLIITLVVSYIGWNRLRNIEDKLHKVEEVNRLITGMVETLEKEKQYIISKDQKYLTDVEKSIADIKSLAGSTRDLFSNPQNRLLMDRIIAAAEEYLKTFLEFARVDRKVEGAFQQWYSANKELYRLDRELHGDIILPKTRLALSNGESERAAHCTEISHRFTEDVFKNFLSLRISAIYYIMLKSEEAWQDYQKASTVMYEGLDRWTAMAKEPDVQISAEKIKAAIDNYGGAGLQFRKLVLEHKELKQSLLTAARKLELAGGRAKMDQKEKMRSLITAEYRNWLWGGTGIIFSLAVLILLLSINMMRRIRAESALKDSFEKQKELERIINFSPAVVFLWTPGKKLPIELVSDNVNQFGYDPEDFYQGRITLSDFLHPEDFPMIMEQMDKNMNLHRSDFTQEYRILTKEKEVRWVDVRIWIRRNHQQEITHFQGIALDITKRKEAEAESRELERQLRQSQKIETIGRLAGGIAHDFNNILQMIYSYAHLVYESLPEDPEIQEDQEQVLKAVERASSLVEQILTFSRQGDQELQHLSVHLIVKETLNMLKALIPVNIEIVRDIDNTCPQIMADPTQIHQVVMNLCTNAYQSIEEKGKIEISLGRVHLENEKGLLMLEGKTGEFVRLIVKDTGIGMTPEVVEHMFDPFYTTKSVGEGTGLGLSVVLGIMKTHKGDIRVESDPGKGSRFILDFPVVQDESVEGIQEKAEETAGFARILYVDDEEEILKSAGKILRSAGYEVRTFSDASTALEEFKGNQKQYDMVITDQAMPGMTGTQLVNEIRKLNTEIPVILTTGFSETVNADNFQEFGFHLYLKKPVSPEALKTSIDQCLQA